MGPVPSARPARPQVRRAAGQGERGHRTYGRLWRSVGGSHQTGSSSGQCRPAHLWEEARNPIKWRWRLKFGPRRVWGGTFTRRRGSHTSQQLLGLGQSQKGPSLHPARIINPGKSQLLPHHSPASQKPPLPRPSSVCSPGLMGTTVQRRVPPGALGPGPGGLSLGHHSP